MVAKRTAVAVSVVVFLVAGLVGVGRAQLPPTSGDGEVVFVDEELGFGQFKTVATSGPLSVQASCQRDGDTVRVRLIGSTTSPAFMAGGSTYGGPDFGGTGYLLPTGQSPAERVLISYSDTQGLTSLNNNIDHGFLFSESGYYIGINGEWWALGHKAAGAPCFFRGVAITMRPRMGPAPMVRPPGGDGLVFVNENLGANEIKTIAKSGPVSLQAHCEPNYDGPGDRIRILATAESIALLAGDDNFFGPGHGPPNPANDFLRSTTPPDDRVLIEHADAGGGISVTNNIDDGFVLGRAGHYIGMDGESTVLGLNAAGGACAVRGVAVVTSQTNGSGPVSAPGGQGLVLIKEKLGYGDVKTIANVGPISMQAHCEANVSGANDRIRILGSSNVLGFQDGTTNDYFGPGGTPANPYLRPSTPPDERILATNTSARPGGATAENRIDTGFVMSRAGHYIGFDAESLALGLNIGGTPCIVRGLAAVNAAPFAR